MVVYSFYIFDRHTECIYSKTWLPPDVHQASSKTRPPSTISTTTAPSAAPTSSGTSAAAPPTATAVPDGRRREKGGRGGDDAKLIFGTVFSLRNMVRKLGGEDDAFISYRTAQYRLHYYETPSSLRMVMLTDTGTMSMRNVLHQIYINLWVEYVVKNPLSPVEHKGGAGVNNELFELGLDQFVRGLM